MKIKTNTIRKVGNLAYMDLCNRDGAVINTTVFDAKFINKIKEFSWSSYVHRNTRYVVTNIPRVNKKSMDKNVLNCIK